MASESDTRLNDPGPKIIFPWGKADPQLLAKKPRRPLPDAAPLWARRTEAKAAIYYFKKGLNISQGYVGDQEIIFILTKPTGGNTEAKSVALWTRQRPEYLEAWRLDLDPRARKAIYQTHQSVNGLWGDGIIWTFRNRNLFEAFTYHNYPYPTDEKLGKSHSSIWADEITVFKRKDSGYIPVGSGVTYYNQRHYPSWPWNQNPMMKGVNAD